MAEDIHLVTPVIDEMRPGRQRRSRNRSAVRGWALAAPVLIISLALFVVPTFEVLRYSFLGENGGVSLERFGKFFGDAFYLKILANTLGLALVTTVITAVLALPFAYALATKPGLQKFQLFALLSPLLINGVVRIFGLQVLLAAINKGLLALGVIQSPLPLLYSVYGIVIGLVLVMFPFMAIAIFASVSKIDDSLLEAARTLGANKFRVFIDIVLPLARPGLMVGSILTFTGASGSYFVPAMMGGNTTITMPVLVFNSVSQMGQWPFGAAVAIVLVTVIMPLLVYSSRKAFSGQDAES